MMRAVALVALLSLTAAAEPRFSRFTSRSDQGRNSRGLLSDSLPFFSAFDIGGAGTFGVCSTTPPTGSRGEPLTFGRASTATCTRTAAGGLATTGIANGDLVTMSSGQPRVEYDSAGVLSLLTEKAGQNVNLQSADLANVVYTSVGAPTVTANTTVAPDNTTTMATIQDTSAAALEGRAQTVIVTAAAAYTMSVFVKAGTLSSVTLSLDGTTATCTSLSATTATRCSVTDVSSSGVAIVAQVTGGTVIGDTGTFIAWGQQVEAGSYMTSYIPTTGAAATRVVEAASFDGLSLSTAAGVSWAATVQHPSANGGGVWGAGANLVGDASNRTQLYRANTNVQQCDIFSTSGSRSVGTVISAYVAGQAYRQACSYSGAGAASTISNYRDGVLISTSAAGLTSAFTIVTVLPGALGAAATTAPSDGITSRICLDSPSRCR